MQAREGINIQRSAGRLGYSERVFCVIRWFMRAMILAAGRGERLRPLTDSCPKPLIEIGGKSLIIRHIQRLNAAGVDTVVINLGWLGERIRERLGDGQVMGVKIVYSPEPPGALETAGGIVQALPLLGATLSRSSAPM